LVRKKGSGPVGAEDKRRTDRINIVVNIEITGKDASGREFEEQGRTLSISRYGAAIVLNRELAPGQQVVVTRPEIEKEATARVLGQIGGQAKGYIYAVTFPDQKVNLWGIVFPPLLESDKAVVRLLLECIACQTREVVYLDELQTEVFEANRSLSRSCKQCAAWTIWKRTPHELLATQAADAATGPVPAEAPAARNKRRDIRVALNKSACVRQPGFGEEIVQVENVSRGGLSFLSSKGYLEGSRIEIAVPYSPGTANIFVPARIVRSRELPEKGLRRYGVAYLRDR